MRNDNLTRSIRPIDSPIRPRNFLRIAPPTRQPLRADRSILPWFATPRWDALLCLIYLLAAIAPLLILHTLALDGDDSRTTQIGINCAVIGFTLLSMQFILTARLPWIEAPFGLDLILYFHRVMAFVIVALLGAHPLLIASSEGWQLINRFHATWCIWLGRGAVLLIIAQIGAAMFRRILRLPYEYWRHAHNAVAFPILGMGFIHGLFVGEKLNTTGGMIVWTAPPVIALAAWLYARAIRPHFLARRPFEVQSVKLEAPRVWTVTLTPPAGQPFYFLPGQFQFLRLIDSELPGQEHPFSIASSAARPDKIRLTIKACGDFTRLIEQIRVGDRAIVHGPFGRFSHELHPEERNLVFIAGGVGITPLISMLRTMHDRSESRRVTLIYANRTLDDILFSPELIALESAQAPLLKVIHVLSQPAPWWTGKTGRVDVDRIDQWCRGLHDKAFFICCPPEVNRALVKALRDHGVSPQRLHCDSFSL